MIEKGVSASVTAVKRVEEVDSGLESMSRKLITGTKLGLASLWRRAYSDYSRERSLIRRGRGELLSLESSPLGVHDAPSSLGSLGPFPWLWWDVSKALEARSPLWSDLEHRDGPRHRLCCSSVCFVFSLSDAMNCLGNGDIGLTQFPQLICVGGEFVGIGLGPPISRGTNSLLGRALGFKDGAQAGHKSSPVDFALNRGLSLDAQVLPMAKVRSHSGVHLKDCIGEGLLGVALGLFGLQGRPLGVAQMI
ncbi:hypothetical protein U1Q18_040520 [Sarracenia purpurea var. burkii]